MVGKRNNPTRPAPLPFIISRGFDAPPDLLFRVWTECDHLMKWWGPQGFTMFSCKIDLRRGGVFHYGMRAPDGKVIWGKFVFRDIVPQERLVFIVSFSDENWGVTRHPLAPDWPLQTLSKITFVEQRGKTTITIEWSPFEATEAECKAFDAGRASMQHGWTGTMNQLAAYLAKVVKRRTR